MLSTLTRFWSDERGQATTEYILILSVVVMISLKFKTSISSKLGDIMKSTITQIDQATQPDSMN